MTGADMCAVQHQVSALLILKCLIATGYWSLSLSLCLEAFQQNCKTSAVIKPFFMCTQRVGHAQKQLRECRRVKVFIAVANSHIERWSE